MRVIGKWLGRTDTPDGKAWFEDFYEMTIPKLIKDYELEEIKVPDHIKAIVFGEDDGTINGVYIIDEGETVIAYSEGCYNTVFNTSGMVVMELWREGERVAQWLIENSPYEMSKKDFEDEDIDLDEIFAKLPDGLTMENTIFVRQL